MLARGARVPSAFSGAQDRAMRPANVKAQEASENLNETRELQPPFSSVQETISCFSVNSRRDFVTTGCNLLINRGKR